MGLLNRNRTTAQRGQGRRRRDNPPARVTVVRGVVVLAVSLFLGYQALQLYNGVPTTNYQKLTVSAPFVGNLLSHDAVRIAGKRIGQVRSVDLDAEGKPMIELQLDPNIKLPSTDTRVRIRANGLLGARFVELVPGDSDELLEDGGELQTTAGSYTYGLPETIDVFDSGTRRGLRQTGDGLGAGMLHNGAAGNATLGILEQRTPQFTDIMRSIQAREGAAERLIPQTLRTFEVFERNTAQVRPWTQAVGDSLEPFITERDAVRDTLTEAPPALAAVDDGLGRGVPLLSAVRELSSAAAQTLPPAPEGFRALSALLDAGRGPLQRALPLAGRARAGLDAPVDILTPLEPIRPRVDEVLQGVRPLLQELDDHSCDFKNGAAALRSMTGFEQTGNAERGRGMAFRLQIVVPGVEAVGIGGAGTLIKRAVYPEDCFYDSKPYPLFGPQQPSASAGFEEGPQR